METIQRRLIPPQKLLQVDPFKVLLLWSNGEIRSNDFTEKIEQWKSGRNKQLANLANPSVFMSATVHDNALAFKKIKIRIPAIEGTQPLDLDPDVMFKDSVKLGRTISHSRASRISRRKDETKEHPIVEIKFSSEGSDLNFGGKFYHLSSARPLIRIGDEIIEIDY